MEFLLYIYISIILLFLANPLYADNDTNLTESKDWIVLPFAFSTEATGTVGGIGVIKQGLFQPQTTLVASIFAGLPEDIVSNGEDKEASFSGGFFYFSDYRLPYANRTFFSVLGLKSYFPNTRYYFNGTNDSSKSSVFYTSGDSNFLNTKLTYVLPIGDGLNNPLGTYSLNNGFCTERDGCGGGIPLITGRTSIGVKTFYQYDTFENSPQPSLSVQKPMFRE